MTKTCNNCNQKKDTKYRERTKENLCNECFLDDANDETIEFSKFTCKACGGPLQLCKRAVVTYALNPESGSKGEAVVNQNSKDWISCQECGVTSQNDVYLDSLRDLVESK